MRFDFAPIRRLGSLPELADRLGVERRTVLRYGANGLSLYQADELAVRMGYHPSELWPEWVGAGAP